VNLKPTVSPAKPSLDQRAFQQLLAAAYALQRHNDHLIERSRACSTRPLHTLLPLESALPLVQYEDERFAALNDPGRLSETACRPSALAFESQARQIISPDPELPFESSALLPGRLLSPARSGVSKGMNTLRLGDVSRPAVWRMIETVSIAAVFCCVMLSASIHRLSAFPAELPRPSESVEQRIATPQPKPVAADFSDKATRGVDRLGSTERSRSDVIAQDTVIRYDKYSSNVQAKTTASLYLARWSVASAQRTDLKSGSRLSFGRGNDMLAADTVVRYGVDFAAHRIVPREQTSPAR
jgi:hypothetical protein